MRTNHQTCPRSIRRCVRVTSCATAAVASVVACLSPAIAQASARPRIVATPAAVAANEATTLKGTGFPASTRIKLQECAKKSWILPEDPCSQKATVKTDASGNFTTTFTVKSCSTTTPAAGEAGGRTKAQKCYVGELETGEDSGALVAAVKLTVRS